MCQGWHRKGHMHHRDSNMHEDNNKIIKPLHPLFPFRTLSSNGK